MENPGLLCECGNAKNATNIACKRCSALDGRTPAIRDVIAVLRASDTVTVAQLAYETGASKDCVTHTLHRLKKRGRTRNINAEAIDSPPGEWIFIQ